jgi:hypothetical protein
VSNRSIRPEGRSVDEVTQWRVTPDGEKQWLSADGNWYPTESAALLAGLSAPTEPRVASPPPPAVVPKAMPTPPPGIYQRPISTTKKVPRRAQIARAFLVIWAVLVVVAFAAGGTTWGVVAIAVPFGLSIGIAKAVGNNANRISKVGVRGATGLQCPKCGGTQFTAKRSAGGKIGLGLLAPKTRVRCVTCRTQFTRG